MPKDVNQVSLNNLLYICYNSPPALTNKKNPMRNWYGLKTNIIKIELK